MRIIICPALPPAPEKATKVQRDELDRTYAARLAEVMQFAKGCNFAVQLAMPPKLDYADQANVARRVQAAVKDWNKIVQAMLDHDPAAKTTTTVLLNLEATADDLSMDTQAEAYKAVRAATIASFGADVVRGAYQVPRLTKGGFLERPADDIRSIAVAELDWFCPSVYRKDLYWRDIGECVRLAALLDYDVVPYISAQFEGDGELIDERDMYRLWATLESHDIDRVIVWANMSHPLAVESLRMCVRVFGGG